MLSGLRFFRQEEIEQEITRDELLKLTLANFHPFGTCEVELLFKVTKPMLCKLDTTTPEFDLQFDKIVFGTMALAVSIERGKYGGKGMPFSPWVMIQQLHDESHMEAVILDVGEKVLLSKELPFDAGFLKGYYPGLIEKVPSIQQRFEGYASTPKAIEEASSSSASCS